MPINISEDAEIVLDGQGGSAVDYGEHEYQRQYVQVGVEWGFSYSIFFHIRVWMWARRFAIGREKLCRP